MAVVVFDKGCALQRFGRKLQAKEIGLVPSREVGDTSYSVTG